MRTIQDITINEARQIIERETGQAFNRSGFICCPFHREKTASLSIKGYADKVRFKCFGCGEEGDLIDFLKKFKGLNYIEVCKYLDLEVNEQDESNYNRLQAIKDYSNKVGERNGWKPIEWYEYFDNEKKEARYYAVKYRTSDGKTMRPYRFNNNGQIIENLKDLKHIPYNYIFTQTALKCNKNIIVVEGEKDVETLRKCGFTAISFKGMSDKDLKEFNWDMFNNAGVFICGDTGAAGEKYINVMKSYLYDHVKGLYIIELPGLEQMGDNKDVTDWIEAGHTKEELKRACKDAWNYKKSKLWKYTKDIKRNNETLTVPLKVTENLEILLKREGISIQYNEISKEIEFNGIVDYGRNAALTTILDLQNKRGLGMSKDQTDDSLNLIAHKHSYNPFIEYLKEHEVKDVEGFELENIIAEVFNCLTINPDYEDNSIFYYNLFKKWMLGVVKMAHNTLNDRYQTQGVLVLQGDQGLRKSTFFKYLLPCGAWFKGDMSLNPDKKDSVLQNTKYILVELGELESTLKAEQAKLKAYFTATSDEVRPPYARKFENSPRITSYGATVNIMDFIKDRTGSRRYWIIPVVKCDIDKLLQIDKARLWGSVYHLYKKGEEIDYLTGEELKTLEDLNLNFKVVNDASIALDDAIDWTKPYDTLYKITDLCNLLSIKDKTVLKNEMERRKIPYKQYKRKGENLGYRYLIPAVEGEEKLMHKVGIKYKTLELVK